MKLHVYMCRRFVLEIKQLSLIFPICSYPAISTMLVNGIIIAELAVTSFVTRKLACELATGNDILLLIGFYDVVCRLGPIL